MLIVLSSLLLASALSSAPGITEVVHTKSATATFTATHELRLIDGKIWWRPRSQTASTLEPWALLPPDGVVSARSRLVADRRRLGLRGSIRAMAFDAPARIIAISADGDELIAVDARRWVYRTSLTTLQWSDRFSAGSRGAALELPAGAAVAMSQRAHPYTDIDGNTHRPDAPVTTVYALASEGSRLLFADARSRLLDGELCLPERGAYRASAMSASGSTIGLLDEAGRVFTRLADLESIGADPAGLYSWSRERRAAARLAAGAQARSLPPEGWRAQPPLPGSFARELTVLQTGRDHNARELRVPTDGGYFVKPLLAQSWRYVATGVPRGDARGISAPPPRSARRSAALRGMEWHGADVRLEQFDAVCPPATLVVERDGERVELELWMRESLEGLSRGRELSGALLLPSSVRGALANDLRALLGDALVEVKVDIDKRRVTIRPANATRAEPRLRFSR